ncbi:MAG: 3-phosphoshikimate 1-carboxyvinyltransferase [Chitinophagaceae bacterium]
MIVKIQPGAVKGSIEAPASKSSMQRALAAALIRKGETVIHNPGISNDDRAALQNIQRLGAEARWEEGKLIVNSSGVNPVDDVIDCGESGLGIRMFTPITAVSNRKLTVTGTGSLTTRPMDFFDEIFPKLGIQIQSNNGKLPMVIQGPLTPANVEVDGSLSSQFLTGLLMAYAAVGAKDVTITVKDLKSKPYIDLTLAVLRDFGWEVEHQHHETFYFPGRKQGIQGKVDYKVEGDWSGAAFLLVAGAIAGDITVSGLDPLSTQADKAVLQAMMAAGVGMSVMPKTIEIRKSKMKGYQFDATECPDLFPPLVALAAYAQGTTVISGAKRLTHKESNRALTLQEEFGKMGVRIELQDDLMVIHGGGELKAAVTHSHHDHRIAMAIAVAALGADGETEIHEAEAINKSYPDFYDDMRLLGAVIQ